MHVSVARSGASMLQHKGEDWLCENERHMPQFEFPRWFSSFGAFAGVVMVTVLTAVDVRAEPVQFGLFGDTPYSRNEFERLPELMGQMDAENLAFIIHDGDFKNGSTPCSDEVFQRMHGVFQKSRHPLVFVPGDNEWTDCHRPKAGGFDPQERLNKLRELFFAGDFALGKRKLKLMRQSKDPKFSEFRENVRWEMGGALFVGLNIPGSDNGYHGTTQGLGPVAEFTRRNAANQAWLAQAFEWATRKKLAGVLVAIQANPGFEAFSAGYSKPAYREFLTQLRDLTLQFGKPVVLVHGDTHWHQIDQPMLDRNGRALVANFTRVETYGAPFMGWVRGTVDPANPKVFTFSPRPLETKP